MKSKLSQTSGVFLTIAGTTELKSLYDIFIQAKVDNPSNELIKYTNKYEELVQDNKGLIENLSALEELIIQMRCKENMGKIKLSILRKNYIYAIAPFYRRGVNGKDIRALIGKTEFEGDDINELYQNKTFMDLCETMLKNSMDQQIRSNKKLLKTIM